MKRWRERKRKGERGRNEERKRKIKGERWRKRGRKGGCIV